MYDSQQIAENIKKVAKDKNIVIKKMLEDVGLSYNAMSNMKTSMPKVDSVAKIADYLGCSVDYLIGRTETLETVHLPDEIISGLGNLLNKKLSNFDDFIIIKDIIQLPRFGSTKDYFVRDIHFEKIEEIYQKAKKYDSKSVMEPEEFKSMFKYFDMDKFLGITVNASGYTISPKNYQELMKIYKVYTESYLADIINAANNKNI